MIKVPSAYFFKTKANAKKKAISLRKKGYKVRVKKSSFGKPRGLQYKAVVIGKRSRR